LDQDHKIITEPIDHVAWRLERVAEAATAVPL